jgi:hypothetical protein
MGQPRGGPQTEARERGGRSCSRWHSGHMAEVISFVTGSIPPERVAELEAAYRDLVHGGPPPALEDTFLVKTDDGRMGILSLWHRRADLDALLESGEEPPARRLIRTHGGEPEATFWDVRVQGSALAGSRE